MEMEDDVTRLLEDLKRSSRSGRARAADKLGEIGDARAVEPLIQSLQDQDTAAEVARALVKTGDLQGILALLKQRVYPLMAAHVLAGLDPFENGIRQAAIEDLGEIEKAEVVELLIQALGDEMEELRAMAALALGGVKDDPRVIEALRQALDDDALVSVEDTRVAILMLGMPQTGYRVAEVAGLSLVRLGDKQSAKRIVRQALDECTWGGTQNRKQDFCRFMFGLGWESVVPELALLCEDKKLYVREMAVSCLGAIGGAQVIDPLIRLLKAKHTDTRKNAAETLGKIGDSSTLDALIQATQDKKWAVRRAARKAIKQIAAKNS